jgi:hypothetical protein
MTTLIQPRSEMQFEQIRLLFRDYRAEVEALVAAHGGCG